MTNIFDEALKECLEVNQVTDMSISIKALKIGILYKEQVDVISQLYFDYVHEDNGSKIDNVLHEYNENRYNEILKEIEELEK